MNLDLLLAFFAGFGLGAIVNLRQAFSSRPLRLVPVALLDNAPQGEETCPE